MLLQRQAVIKACDRAIAYIEQRRRDRFEARVDYYLSLAKPGFFTRLFRVKWEPPSREAVRIAVEQNDPVMVEIVMEHQDLYNLALKLRTAARISTYDVMEVDMNDLYMFHVCYE